jgi:hypothetical protein
MAARYRKTAERPMPSWEQLYQQGLILRRRDEARLRPEARLANPVQGVKDVNEQGKIEEERMAVSSKSIRIGDRNYTWQELSNPSVRRAILPQVEQMIREMKHNPDAYYKMGWTKEDLSYAIRWTVGEFDGYSEEAMTKLTGGLQPAATATLSGRELAKEIGRLANTPEYKMGSQKRATGQELTAAQKAAVDKMDQLEALTDTEARAERPPLPGKYKTEKPYVSTRIQEIAKLPPAEQVNAAREYRAQLKADPAYLNERDVNHRHVVEEVHRTYLAESYTDQTPVLPDDAA